MLCYWFPVGRRLLELSVLVLNVINHYIYMNSSDAETDTLISLHLCNEGNNGNHLMGGNTWRAAVITVFCLLSGCASNPYDRARNFAVGAVLADAATTHHKLHEGCGEGNSLYDGTTNKDQIIIINVAIAGVVWWMADELKDVNGPTWPLWLAGAFRAGVTVNNLVQDCSQ